MLVVLLLFQDQVMALEQVCGCNPVSTDSDLKQFVVNQPTAVPDYFQQFSALSIELSQ